MVISMLDWVVSPDSQVISQVVSQPITKGTKAFETRSIARSFSRQMDLSQWLARFSPDVPRCDRGVFFSASDSF